MFLRLSSHPFIDPLGTSGFPWNNGSDSRFSDSKLRRRFLHDLDTYKPRERLSTFGSSASNSTSSSSNTRRVASTRRHGHGYRPDTDDDFLRVLEMSREEFESDKQMSAGKVLLHSDYLYNTHTHTHRYGISQGS